MLALRFEGHLIPSNNNDDDDNNDDEQSFDVYINQLGITWAAVGGNILLHESLTSFFLLSKWTFYRLARKLWHFDFGKQKSRKDGENAKSLFESENCRKLRRIGCDTNAAKATTHTALAEGKGYEGKSEFIICNNLDETTRCTASGQAAHKLLTEN